MLHRASLGSLFAYVSCPGTGTDFQEARTSGNIRAGTALRNNRKRLIEMFEVHHMKRSDFDTVAEWTRAEGWNPGLSDVECFWMSDPSGFYMGKLDGVPVTSISAIRYGQSFAFVGFYLCHPEYRGKGFGMWTWQHVVDKLDVATIGLDGVIEQQANYTRSGFTFAHRNIRFGGTPSVGTDSDIDIRTLASDRIRAVDHYDRACFGVDRIAFLETWLSTRDHLFMGAWNEGTLTGYGVARPAHEGTRIGPLFADDDIIAAALFDALVSDTPAGPVYLDIPEPNEAAQAMARARGLEPVSETARMYKGASWLLPLEKVFGITTLELG